jgi:hypothetical protein
MPCLTPPGPFVWVLPYLCLANPFPCPPLQPQALSVESLPEPFFPQDLPVVSEEDPKSKWPAPASASCALRTYDVTPSGVTEVTALRKTVQWPASWSDCERPVTGKEAWLAEEEAKAAPTVAVLPPIVVVREAWSGVPWVCAWEWCVCVQVAFC